MREKNPEHINDLPVGVQGYKIKVTQAEGEALCVCVRLSGRISVYLLQQPSLCMSVCMSMYHVHVFANVCV